MCIILYKPAGVIPPELGLLHSCWEANPDGFGLAIADGNSVTIAKGAMTERAAFGLYTTVQPEHAAIYHWRIATSGLIDGGNCHPFPVSASSIELRKLHLTGLSYAVAHNGVISAPPKGSRLSDTQIWVKDSLVPAMEYLGDAMQLFLDRAAAEYSSRFVLLKADKTATLSGHWHKEGEYLLSNLSYQWAGTGQYFTACPVCGSYNVTELADSVQGLTECWDCLSVFNEDTVFLPQQQDTFTFDNPNFKEAM